MSETLSAPASFEQIIKQSRFLVRAWPIDDVAQAEQLIAEVCAAEASNHCWAWRLGDRYRFHDANEPSGTAGRPILSAIEGQGLDAVLVVVSRWFGGIKLGTGGLVRAFGGSAAECLRLAERRTIIERCVVKIWLPPDDQGPVRHLLQSADARRLDEGFCAADDGPGMLLWLELDVPRDAVATLQAQLVNATAGRLRWQSKDTDLASS